MKNYYVLVRKGQSGIIDSKVPINYTKKRYKGESLDPDSEFRIYFEKENSTRDIVDLGKTFTVSKRLKELLSSYESNLEFHTVELVNDNDGKIDKAWHVNILNKIDAFDFEKSDYEYLEENENGFSYVRNTNSGKTGNPDKTYSIVLHEDLIKERTVFRINKGGLSTMVIISESLAKKIKEEDISGCSIYPLESYPFGNIEELNKTPEKYPRFY